MLVAWRTYHWVWDNYPELTGIIVLILRPQMIFLEGCRFWIAWTEIIIRQTWWQMRKNTVVAEELEWEYIHVSSAVTLVLKPWICSSTTHRSGGQAEFTTWILFILACAWCPQQETLGECRKLCPAEQASSGYKKDTHLKYPPASSIHLECVMSDEPWPSTRWLEV